VRTLDVLGLVSPAYTSNFVFDNSVSERYNQNILYNIHWASEQRKVEGTIRENVRIGSGNCTSTTE